MSNCKLGIIGGSGLYEIEAIEDSRWKKVKTPWGSPSDEILVFTYKGIEACFLPRHGKGHKISPTNINFRANIDALKQLGVTDINICFCCWFPEGKFGTRMLCLSRSIY